MIEVPKHTRNIMSKAYSKINSEHLEQLELHANNVDEFLKLDNITDILDDTDTILTYLGFDENDDLTDFGRELQNLYDDIYYNN
ncbi:hypothetical protein D3Z33_15755 [Senegalia massiliensis]|uniref:Uncharacterized protein n=2 Tax=Senegalia massiliensis TaxID=1720316 RepID=A0A845R3X5_9CLOT|nr:hypothetical protein [Senegalia massiliensis]